MYIEIYQILILSFYVYDGILCSYWEDAILVFGLCQPLMFVLTFIPKKS